jgi:hypothetical protein
MVVVLVEHVSFAGHGEPSSHITVCPLAAVQSAAATHATLAASPVDGSSVTQHTSPGGLPSAAQSAASSHGTASSPEPLHPEGTVHTADELPPLLDGVTQQMSVVASHELPPHWMDALEPDELPELDPLDDEELLLLLDDDLPPDDELPPLDDELLDDLPPDELPELDPPPELDDDADVPPFGPSKSPSLVAPPHAAITNAASAPTMHPLEAMPAEPM